MLCFSPSERKVVARYPIRSGPKQMTSYLTDAGFVSNYSYPSLLLATLSSCPVANIKCHEFGVVFFLKTRKIIICEILVMVSATKTWSAHVSSVNKIANRNQHLGWSREFVLQYIQYEWILVWTSFEHYYILSRLLFTLSYRCCRYITRGSAKSSRYVYYW